MCISRTDTKRTFPPEKTTRYAIYFTNDTQIAVFTETLHPLPPPPQKKTLNYLTKEEKPTISKLTFFLNPTGFNNFERESINFIEEKNDYTKSSEIFPKNIM